VCQNWLKEIILSKPVSFKNHLSISFKTIIAMNSNKKVDLISLQMKCISVIQKIDAGKIEEAKETALHLHDMIIAEQKSMEE
jgi:hypothetical protein